MVWMFSPSRNTHEYNRFAGSSLWVCILGYWYQCHEALWFVPERILIGSYGDISTSMKIHVCSQETKLGEQYWANLIWYTMYFKDIKQRLIDSILSIAYFHFSEFLCIATNGAGYGKMRTCICTREVELYLYSTTPMSNVRMHSSPHRFNSLRRSVV